MYWSGSHHISAAASSRSAAASLLPTPQPSCVEYRRDRSSDRYYSCSTQRTCGSLSVTICGHTCTPTIRRSMASASSSSHSAPRASICMYQRRGCVDAVELAPAEHCKDRSYLVCIESTAASTTTGRSESWY